MHGKSYKDIQDYISKGDSQNDSQTPDVAQIPVMDLSNTVASTPMIAIPKRSIPVNLLEDVVLVFRKCLQSRHPKQKQLQIFEQEMLLTTIHQSATRIQKLPGLLPRNLLEPTVQFSLPTKVS